MMLATEPVMVRLPASVDAIASASHPVCGSGNAGTSVRSSITAGTLLTTLESAAVAVTNTGSYGSEFGTPLLNPGHAVTIALGVIAPRALVIDGTVEARPACTLSLTFDHRVLDGASVGRAFGALVELLESHERLDTLPR